MVDEKELNNEELQTTSGGGVLKLWIIYSLSYLFLFLIVQKTYFYFKGSGYSNLDYVVLSIYLLISSFFILKCMFFRKLFGITMKMVVTKTLLEAQATTYYDFIKFWWSFFWRWVLWGMVFNVICGELVNFPKDYLGFYGYITTSLLNFLSSFIIGFFAFRTITQISHGNYKIIID
jgi:hypothetical protein